LKASLVLLDKDIAGEESRIAAYLSQPHDSGEKRRHEDDIEHLHDLKIDKAVIIQSMQRIEAGDLDSDPDFPADVATHSDISDMASSTYEELKKRNVEIQTQLGVEHDRLAQAISSDSRMGMGMRLGDDKEIDSSVLRSLKKERDNNIQTMASLEKAVATFSSHPEAKVLLKQHVLERLQQIDLLPASGNLLSDRKAREESLVEYIAIVGQCPHGKKILEDIDVRSLIRFITQNSPEEIQKCQEPEKDSHRKNDPNKNRNKRKNYSKH